MDDLKVLYELVLWEPPKYTSIWYLVFETGGRQCSDTYALSSQISDNLYYLQFSDREKGSLQFSDTHRKETTAYKLLSNLRLKTLVGRPFTLYPTLVEGKPNRFPR